MDDRGLIRQTAFSDWQDSLSRSGFLSYVNLLHLLFLEKYAQILGVVPLMNVSILRKNILSAFFDTETGLLYAGEDHIFHDLDSQLIALEI